MGQLTEMIQNKPVLKSNVCVICLVHKAVIDEGLWLQQSLHEVLSLLKCLAATVSNQLQKDASEALDESTSVVESLSTCLVSFLL